MTHVFRFSILADSNWEVKIDKGLNYFGGIQRHFEGLDYGEDLKGVVVVMMCRSPELNFKQRKRYSRKDKVLYLDVMLDYEEMLQTQDDLTKGKILLNHINKELFTLLDKYKFNDFDLLKFQSDFHAFVKMKGLQVSV